ncbi:MAG: dihydropteroate synthase [Acidobacteria bacterium]|nr:dihydropteroate synthase [Acidobacteriota bacterium]
MTQPAKSVLTNRREIHLPGTPLIMGVLNVTPDSFYDGKRFFSVEAAVEHGLRLIGEGADILDVGGESSRPGARPLSKAEEQERVLPVLEALRRHADIPLSIDTWKPETARSAVMAGAEIINDISGLRNPEMVRAAADTEAAVVAMHMRGYPWNMQELPPATDIFIEINTFFTEILKLPLKKHKIILDPGIGFGKTVQDNLLILNRLENFKRLECPLLVGASRKSFIGKITGLPADNRLPGSLAAAVLATVKGAAIIRCHDVAETRQAVTVAVAIIQEKLA